MKLHGKLALSPRLLAGRISLDDIAPQETQLKMASRRLRLLSYVGRWGRARRWLPADIHRVVDVGCAFGYGTAALAGGRSAPWIVGVERDAEHVQEAGRRYPWLSWLRGDATALPLCDEAVDAVVMLDVLEHVPNPCAILAEVRRVLRPGGCLVFSVPHKGLLSSFDSANVYTALRQRWRFFPPLEPCEESAMGLHRHFTIEEAQALLGSRFTVDRVACTGLGVVELLHLVLLISCKALLGWREAYLVFRHLYFAAYLLEDLIPTGRLGYHLTIRARAV